MDSTHANLERNISEISVTTSNLSLDEKFDHDMSVSYFKDLLYCSIHDEIISSDETQHVLNYIRNKSGDAIKGNVNWLLEIIDSDTFTTFFSTYLKKLIDEGSLNSPRSRLVTNFIKLLMSLWNCSDKREDLCSRLVNCGIHTQLIKLLGSPQLSTRECVESRNRCLVAHCIVGTLHNISISIPHSRGHFRLSGAVDVITPFATEITSNDRMIQLKTAALLLLSFLVNEDENKTLNAEDVHLIYIVNILNTVLECENFFSEVYGYHALEILKALKNIAGSDRNKRILVKNGLLQSITCATHLPIGEEEEHALMELLWSLSFADECRAALLQPNMSELRDRIAVLDKSSSNKISLPAQGILWNLHSCIERVNSIDAIGRRPGHVFISYQHSTQAVMVKIKDALIYRGYSVWMDVDYMTGSFLDGMAEAIEQAAVVVLGLCQAFKNSPHCRYELRFAYIKRIPLVPVLLEPNFEPDGWLGFLLATIIYTPFTDMNNFDDSMFHLTRQLGPLGMVDTPDTSVTNGLKDPCKLFSPPPSNELSTGLSSVAPADLSKTPSTFDSTDGLKLKIEARDASVYQASPHALSLISSLNEGQMSGSLHTNSAWRPKQPETHESVNFNSNEGFDWSSTSGHAVYWTHDRVKGWLEDCGLGIYAEGFGEVDGSLLYEMYLMRKDAPEAFYKTLREDHKMVFVHLQRFTKCLRQLFIEYNSIDKNRRVQ